MAGIERSVMAGQRIGILGANGQGKSTVVKTIAGMLKPLGGQQVEGKGLAIGYFAQQEMDLLREDDHALGHMTRLAREVSPEAREQELRNFLGQFNFSGELALQRVDSLSGGERARLVLALIAWQKPNLLLLDEPTNHLDLTTREALSMALNGFEGTVLLVSHDRALLRETCEQFWLVADGQLSDFDGDLDDYQRWLNERAKAEQRAERSAERANAPPPMSKQDRKAAAALRLQAAPLRKQMDELDRSLQAAGKERAQLEAELGAGSANGERIAAIGKRLKAWPNRSRRPSCAGWSWANRSSRSCSHEALARDGAARALPARRLRDRAARPAGRAGGDSGFQAKPGWQFQRQAVVAAHPLAAEAGAALLRAGGNAIDAAVATQLVLGLVEPQSSGIGGGGFLLFWDGQRLHAYDGRETAPAAATETLFLRADGSPMTRDQATRSGLAVGVPACCACWKPRIASMAGCPGPGCSTARSRLPSRDFRWGNGCRPCCASTPLLRGEPAAAALYYQANGEPLPLGTPLRNPAQAALLRRVAREGADAFYRGAIAEDLLNRVQSAPRPGAMRAADLRDYRVERREPLCHAWRQWRLCGLPPPAAGHLLSAQILGLLDPLPNLQQAEGLHRYAEAARLASADRDQHVGDPRFVAPPAGRWSSLLDAGVPGAARQADRQQGGGTRQRRPTRRLQRALGAAAGVGRGGHHAFQRRRRTGHGGGDDQQRRVRLRQPPAGRRRYRPARRLLPEQPADRLRVPAPRQPGRALANRAEGGKRPRSSMNPMLVFDAQGRLEMALGSPGGLAIPHYTVRLLLLSLGQGQALQAAIAAPNLAMGGDSLLLEPGAVDATTLADLRERGHRVLELPLTSGLHALRRRGGQWEAGADPRREGSAAGD